MPGKGDSREFSTVTDLRALQTLMPRIKDEKRRRQVLIVLDINARMLMDDIRDKQKIIEELVLIAYKYLTGCSANK